MHESLKPFAAALQIGKPQKVVMFGDSITFGSQVDPAYDHEIVFHRQWENRLRQRFPSSQITAINKGIPGNKIHDALARYDRDVIAESPDLVVIEFGVNDCWNGPDGVDAYEQGLRQLVDELKSATSAPLVLLTANMMNFQVTHEALHMAWFAETSCSAQTSGWMDLYMDRMRKVARDCDLALADGYAHYQKLRSQGVDTDALLVNGANHPNEYGHKILCDAMCAVLDF